MVMAMANFHPTAQTHPKDQSFILSFEEVGIADIPLVGGKNASLGEMIQQLSPQGVKVPLGFATTAYAYRYFIQKAGLEPQLRELLADLDVNDVNNLQDRGQRARELMLKTPFPTELDAAIAAAYESLCDRYQPSSSSNDETLHWIERLKQSHNIDVAVRSSATAEDLPDASFAGQQETYLNVHGVFSVVEACLQIALFPIAPREGLITSPLPYPSECKKWCALTWLPLASCFRLILKQALRMPFWSALPTVWAKM
jgi:pyruvate, water dikinase